MGINVYYNIYRKNAQNQWVRLNTIGDGAASQGFYQHPHINLFFSRIEVQLDGQRVPPNEMGDQQFVYANFNKTFMTKEKRKLKYGNIAERPSRDEDHYRAENGDRTDKNAILQNLGNSMHAGTKDFNVSFVYFDGNWVFDSFSNLCQAKYERNSYNGYFHPAVKFEAQFHKVKPLHALLQVNAISLNDQFTAGNLATPPDLEASDLKITLKGLEMIINSMTPNPGFNFDKYKFGKSVYYADVPFFKAKNIEPNVKNAYYTFSIPAHTKIIFAFTTLDHNLYYNAATHKSLHPGARLVTRCTDIRFNLDGKPVLAEFGLDGTGSMNKFTSDKAYYDQLMNQQMYDRTMEDMFSADSVDQVFIIDCTYMNMKHSKNLGVQMTFSDDSPTNWVLGCIPVVQVEHSCHYDKALDRYIWNFNRL